MRRAGQYHRRSGSWFAAEGVPLTEVMRDRFGDPSRLVPEPR